MSTLIIPTKIAATQPKPTKRQIAEALLDRAREQHIQKEQERSDRHDQLNKEAIILAERLTGHVVTKVELYGSKLEITIRLADKPLAQLVKQRDALDKYSWFREHEVKEMIKKSMETPNPLLGNPDTAKALDALLSSILNPKAKSKNNTVDV